MSEERMQILKMLEEGKVSAKEAAELLSAVEKPAERVPPEALRGRRLRVLVTDLATGKQKVNITVPLGMVDVALRMGARFVPKTASFDPQEVLEAIRSGSKGKIIEYEDQQDKERVDIYID